MSKKRDYYEILGVNKSSSQAEIKKAYHKLAMQYHPDRNSTDPDAEKKFKEINQAYDVLKDDQKKAAYDSYGHDAFEHAASSGGYSQHGGSFNGNVNDIFGDFFKDFMGGHGGRRQRSDGRIRGADLKYNISVTLEEAFAGVEKTIQFNAEVLCGSCKGTGSEGGSTSVTQCDVCHGAGVTRIQQGFFAIEQTCHKCHGAGQFIEKPCKKCHGNGRALENRKLQVNIPAGIEDGTRIRLVGEGEAGIRGGGHGDLYVVVAVRPHDIFKVSDSDLHCRLPISFSKAALGGDVEVPSIEGNKLSLHIPAGSQTDEKLKLKGKGMSKVRSAARGDMYVHLYVEVPKTLTKKQKELIEALDKELGEAKDGNFFNKMKNLWGK